MEPFYGKVAGTVILYRVNSIDYFLSLSICSGIVCKTGVADTNRGVEVMDTDYSKIFVTGLAVNEFLFLNSSCRHGNYLLLFNCVLSKTIKEKCWKRILNLHKLFTHTWWKSTKSDVTQINPLLKSVLFHYLCQRDQSKTGKL